MTSDGRLSDELRRIGRFGMYRVCRNNVREKGGRPLWLPRDDDDFLRVFEHPTSLITIESMSWRVSLQEPTSQEPRGAFWRADEYQPCQDGPIPPNTGERS